MAYALARRLERAVKNAGVKFKTVKGWSSRGHGAMGVIQSVMCHHTAGPARGNSPSLNVVTYGRPGLSGPLAQIFLARDGTVYLVAAGRSYHAGVVTSSLYQNSHSVGIEAEATGVSSWPKAQINAYAKLCRALAREFSFPVSRVVGHKEKCSPRGRKIDPNFNMGQFRKKVSGAKGGVSSGGGSTGGSKSYKAVAYGTTLGKWDKGDPVRDWQDFLVSQGYDLGKGGVDGFFGDSIVSATRSYQRKVGVTDDGMAGSGTWAKAKKDGFTWKRKPKKSSKPKPKKKSPGKPKKFPWGKGHYIGPKSGPNSSHSGFHGNDSAQIKAFVNQLIKRGWNIGKGKTYLSKFGNDGKYGSELRALIRAFQRDQGLKVDGYAGRETWNAAFKNPVT